MRLVRFDGRGRLLAFGHELWSGQSVEMSNEDAAQLEADPHVRVTVTKVAKQDPTPPVGEPEAHEGEGQPTNNRETKE